MSSEEEFPKVLGFEVLKGCGEFELKLEDGSVIRVLVEPSAVTRMGNDPSTGAPAYAVTLGALMVLRKVPQELIKKPAKPPTGGAVYRRARSFLIY
jgi:hypothetical protein